jgi:hypothetical protein
MNQWISVKDKLPKIGETVWACFEGQFQWVQFCATMTPHDGLFASGYAEPTYWMPLPDPPEAQP